MKNQRRRTPLAPFLLSGLLLTLSTMTPLSSARQGAADERLVIGVLEHNDSEGKKWHGVRVAFRKEGGQWKAYPTDFDTEEELLKATRSYPAEVAWTVCSDGRS